MTISPTHATLANSASSTTKKEAATGEQTPPQRRGLTKTLTLRGVGLFNTQLQHEWMLQRRSFRFKFGLLLYCVFGALGPLSLLLQESNVATTLSPATRLMEAFHLLPFSTILFTLVVVGNTTRLGGLKAVLVSAPMSNSGFVLRKLTAQVAIVLFGSVLATAISVLAASWNQLPELPLRQAFGMWVVVLVPRIVIAAAGWLGAVLVLRSEIAAFFSATIGLSLFESALNQLLFRTGVVLRDFDWLELTSLVSWANVQRLSLQGQGVEWDFLQATETRFQVVLAWQQVFTHLLLPAAVAALMLGLGIGYLDRCRADVRPGRLGELHPLRTFAIRLGKLRDSLRPDAGLTVTDKLLRALLASLAVALLCYGFVRGHSWQKLLEEKYRTLESEMATTPFEVRPVSWTAAGVLDASGSLSLSGTATLVNQGKTPVAKLAFELDRHQSLDRFETSGRALTFERHWDRLLVDLEPALAANEEITLRFETSGDPSEDVLRLPKLSDESPVEAWDRHTRARFPRERSPLLHSRVQKRVSAARTLLPSSSLFPTPRFTSWARTKEEESFDSEHRDVLEEAHTPTVTIELDINVPSGWLIADSCGNASDPDSGTLNAVCRQDLQSFTVAGGERALSLGDHGRIRFATLKSHTHHAEQSTLAMERVLALASRVAELSQRDGTTVTAMEMPDAFELDRSIRIWGPRKPDATTLGQLIVVPESRLVDPEPIAAPELVASILLYRLRPAVEMPAADERAFLALYRTLLLSRMGEQVSSAVVAVKPWHTWRLSQPLVGANIFDSVIWQIKAPALLKDLEVRVGREQLLSGFREYLEVQSQETSGTQADSRQRTKATLRDVITAIEQQAGISLQQFYDDFIAGRALPRLELQEVKTVQDRDHFLLRGLVKNAQSGHARCEIRVKTDQEVFSKTIEIPPRQATSFEFETKQRPFTIELDPERECYRLRPLNSQDSLSLKL